MAEPGPWPTCSPSIRGVSLATAKRSRDSNEEPAASTRRNRQRMALSGVRPDPGRLPMSLKLLQDLTSSNTLTVSRRSQAFRGGVAARPTRMTTRAARGPAADHRASCADPRRRRRPAPATRSTPPVAPAAPPPRSPSSRSSPRRTSRPPPVAAAMRACATSTTSTPTTSTPTTATTSAAMATTGSATTRRSRSPKPAARSRVRSAIACSIRPSPGRSSARAPDRARRSPGR